MGSRLAFGCMRNVSYGICRGSVASLGVERRTCSVTYVDGHGRCTKLVPGLW